MYNQVLCDLSHEVNKNTPVLKGLWFCNASRHHRAPLKTLQQNGKKLAPLQPDKRRPPPKTHRLCKEGINQRFSKDALMSSQQRWVVSVHRMTVSHTLHRVGLYGNSMWQCPQPHGRRISGQMRLKSNFLATVGNSITPRTQLPSWSMLLATLCRGDVFHWSGLKLNNMCTLDYFYLFFLLLFVP